MIMTLIKKKSENVFYLLLKKVNYQKNKYKNVFMRGKIGIMEILQK